MSLDISTTTNCVTQKYYKLCIIYWICGFYPLHIFDVCSYESIRCCGKWSFLCKRQYICPDSFRHILRCILNDFFSTTMMIMYIDRIEICVILHDLFYMQMICNYFRNNHDTLKFKFELQSKIRMIFLTRMLTFCPWPSICGT